MRRIIRTGDFKVTEEEKRLILDVLDSSMITEHEKTKEFEKKWAEKIGTKYCVSMNSGTSALITGLYALKNIVKDKKRKKVITTPLTFIADSNAIRLSGLEPVYGDIDPVTFGIMPSEIERILREDNPKSFLAILPVHLMGYPCDMDSINNLAKEYDLFVFEDSAQSHLTKYKDRNVGSIGDLACFSFYVAHNLQVGELGAITTNNLEIRNLSRKIKAHGRACICDTCRRMEGKCPQASIDTEEEEDIDPRFNHDILGFNFKSNDIFAALAVHRIKEVEEINKKRFQNVSYLNEGLKKHDKILQLPVCSEKVSYLSYPLILKKSGDRRRIRGELEERGIETRIMFGCIPLQQPSFSDLKEEYEGKLPNAEIVGRNGFYIGCHQYLEKRDLDDIIDSFNEILK